MAKQKKKAANLKQKGKKKINEVFLASIFIFIWPFIYCYRYVFANGKDALTIGNDFGGLYYNYKVYLLDALSNFNIPLWSPSEGCGFPFYSNPFTQTFYPLNIILTFFYKINEGYSFADHQKFAVLGLSLFGLGLFLWLRSLKVSLRASVFAVCIISVSYKIMEILRFPNAVHTAAWIPFLLYGCTIAMNKSKWMKSAAVIFFSNIMFLTAGYPYYIYYSVFLLGPYLLLLIYLGNKKKFLSESFDLKKFIVAVGSGFILSLLFCSPYLLKVQQMLSQTVNRSGSDFAYSTAHEFTFMDTLGSLLFPPAAQMEGWYYFGMVSLLLMGFYAIYLFLNARQQKNEVKLFAIIVMWLAIISYITYGKQSYLFKFLWDYLPGFSSLRVWGRLNIILLPVFAFLLAMAYDRFERVIRDNFFINKKSRKVILIFSFVILYIILFGIQYYLLDNKLFDKYWLDYFKSVFKDFDEGVFITMGFISFLLILLLSLVKFKLQEGKLGMVLLVLLLMVNAFDVYKAASLQWAIPQKPDTKRNELRVHQLNLKSLTSPRYYAYATISLNERFSAGYVPDWYYNNYVQFAMKHGGNLFDPETKNLSMSFATLMGLVDGKRFFCSDSIRHENPENFLNDSRNFEEAGRVKININKYTGDELIMTVETDKDGYCSFIDNWDPNWKAAVNGQAIEIERLFNTFKSVKIKKGTNKVELIYKGVF